ncbi:alpha/beta-hydrolase [Cucurbitaria berberidis CBS 394.84]|uniref:Alpha/beta-hydrolase n=1 Tax=Cucurbitaria berberidis CBS 394.84 TaxID=1168544 RepID=A0A9P4GSB6_9PLEO|nr:alpha/beta-hydrolase [Cucurbitaria berberidis CBS 394.84]KAF1850561.1 alpha/beta-hydrolase [Cucurbitaria berberidis CBS 394.84]
MSIYTYIGVPLSFLSGIWIPCTLLCCIPWVQKQMLYLHSITFSPGKWLTEPERAGFLKNQVTPFRIATEDGESLFAWLVAPLGIYARHADDFIQEPSGVEDIEEKLAFRILKNDPDARLLIYFHGNSATIAQQRRTEEYRSFSSGASEKIFILAFDYRGFGASTGTPSELGLLNDAAAVVDWALNRCRIPPDRIVLLGHSLGTAVVAGVAHHYSKLGVAFAGLILCAAFTNAGSAFSSYSIGGLIPVLAPVKLSATFQTWFSRRMEDTWRTDDRLGHLTRTCSRLRLVLVHAEDDQTMPWNQTEELFKSTLKAASENGLNDEAGAINGPEVRDLGEAGRQEIWQNGSCSISKTIAKHGDHNQIMTWSPVALAILQVFGLAASTARL